MSRYAIQWILFVVFCAVMTWLWFGDELSLPESGPAPAAQKPAPVADALLPVATEKAPDAPPPAAAPDRPDPLLEFEVLLSEGRYDAAVERYSSLYDRVSEAESNRYRLALFAHTEDLHAQRRYEEALTLMRRYTSVFYRDLAGLALMARSQHELDRFPEEINTLMAALDTAYLEPDIAALRARLDEAVSAQAVALSNDPHAVLAFYRDLVLRRPGYENLQMGLSRALLRVGRTDEAATVLGRLTSSTEHGDDARELLQSIAQKRLPDTASVPMRRTGSGFAIDAVVNGRYTVTLVIDTGATLTTIRPQALQRAGVNVRAAARNAEFNTANGVVRGSVVRVDSLALGEHQVDNIEVGTIPLPGLDEVDGLLGMNFLRQFKFTLNQREQVLLLNR